MEPPSTKRPRLSGEDSPSYQAPLYQAPLYQAPSYQAPSYQAPSYQAPSYQAPSYQAPSYQAPAFQAPAFQAPAYQAPPYQPPPYQTLIYQAPLCRAPICLFPTDQVPVYQAPPPPVSVSDALSYLNESEILQIVYSLLSRPDAYPLVISLINGTYNAKCAAEQQKVVDFDHFSKSVWHSLNRKWTDPRGSKEYENAGHAHRDVTDAIQSIRDNSGVNTSFGTRKSALVTLRKIGKSVAMAPDVLGHEVRKEFQYDDCLVDAMSCIVEQMSIEEQHKIRELDDGEFMDKLEELIDLAHFENIWENLQEVLNVLLGKALTDENEPSDNEGEDEETRNGSAEDG